MGGQTTERPVKYVQPEHLPKTASITTPPVNRATLDFTKANREAPLVTNAQAVDTNSNKDNNSVCHVSRGKHNIKQAKQPAWSAWLADIL